MTQKTIFFGMLVFIMIFSRCSKGVEITSNERFTHDGYDYEFWTDSRSYGSGSMTLGRNGTFSCEWEDTYNILFRMGKRYGDTERRTHSEIGTFTLDYRISGYNPVGTSYVTVYGWTLNPLAEFYIVENWGPNDFNGYEADKHTLMGTITIDGGTYDIYVSTRIRQPSIQGRATFNQYWSIRRERRTRGTVSISEHFKAWQEAGLDMSGRMYEVTFCIEAFGGDERNASGSAKVTRNTLRINGVKVNAK
jgi:endo-1,4-beta-xylanase